MEDYTKRLQRKCEDAEDEYAEFKEAFKVYIIGVEHAKIGTLARMLVRLENESIERRAEYERALEKEKIHD